MKSNASLIKREFEVMHGLAVHHLSVVEKPGVITRIIPGLDGMGGFFGSTVTCFHSFAVLFDPCELISEYSQHLDF